jgi:hypothetical protein
MKTKRNPLSERVSRYGRYKIRTCDPFRVKEEVNRL